MLNIGSIHLCILPEKLHRQTKSDHDEKNILEVGFADGIYHYFNVPQNVWKEYKIFIESGGSSGKFVNVIVKPFYKCQKLED